MADASEPWEDYSILPEPTARAGATGRPGRWRHDGQQSCERHRATEPASL